MVYRTANQPSIYRPDYRESTPISSRPSNLMAREKVKPTIYITFQPVDVIGPIPIVIAAAIIPKRSRRRNLNIENVTIPRNNDD